MEFVLSAGRPTDYEPKYCRMVKDHMSTGASLTSFAASIGKARSTMNLWMDAFPEFMEAVKVGKAQCAAWWESVNRQNASAGGGNATSCIFGLKNMAPDDWGDRQEINHTSSDGSMSPASAEDTAQAVLNRLQSKHEDGSS